MGQLFPACPGPGLLYGLDCAPDADAPWWPRPGSRGSETPPEAEVLPAPWWSERPEVFSARSISLSFVSMARICVSALKETTTENFRQRS